MRPAQPLRCQCMVPSKVTPALPTLLGVPSALACMHAYEQTLTHTHKHTHTRCMQDIFNKLNVDKYIEVCHTAELRQQECARQLTQQ